MCQLTALTKENLCAAPKATTPGVKLNDDFVKSFFRKKENHKNTDKDLVAAKIAIIEMTYSSGLRFRFESDKSIYGLAEKITQIKGLDEKIKTGNFSAVDEIVSICNEYLKSKMFSFATKFCFIHNYYCYEKDDYSIYDSAIEKLFPLYAREYGFCTDLTSYRLSKYKDTKYSEFNNLIGDFLKSQGLDGVKQIRFKFDRLMWNQRDL